MLRRGLGEGDDRPYAAGHFCAECVHAGGGQQQPVPAGLLGISSLEYFRVYNRWGQLLFSTSQMGQGWDGRIQGQLQESNAYLWMLRGTDYTGKVIAKKGTVVLIR